MCLTMIHICVTWDSWDNKVSADNVATPKISRLIAGSSSFISFLSYSSVKADTNTTTTCGHSDKWLQWQTFTKLLDGRQWAVRLSWEYASQVLPLDILVGLLLWCSMQVRHGCFQCAHYKLVPSHVCCRTRKWVQHVAQKVSAIHLSK